MKLALVPNGMAVEGKHRSYVVALPHGTAIIDKLPSGPWQLTVREGDGQLVNRGMFGSTYDVLTLLEAEWIRSQRS